MKNMITRNTVILGVIVGAIIGVVLIASNFSFIEVSSVNTESEIRISKQPIDQLAPQNPITQSAQTYRKLVRKGDYEVTSMSSSGSFSTQIATKGFFTTVRVDIAESPETAREFIGVNPKNCVLLSREILHSYDCGTFTNSLSRHNPASAMLPSTVSDLPLPYEGVIEGSVSVNEETFVVIRTAPGGGNRGSAHTLNRIFEDGSMLRVRSLSQLSDDLLYEVRQTSDGFIAYSEDRDAKIFSLTESEAEPKNIELPSNVPTDTSLEFADQEGDVNVLVYYEEGVIKDTDFNTIDSGDFDSENVGGTSIPLLGTPEKEKELINPVIYYRIGDGAWKQIKFGGKIDDVDICGTNLLCILTENRLQVREISEKGNNLKYTIDNVLNFEKSENNTLITKPDGVWTLDTSTSTSHRVLYGDSSAEYCGLSYVPKSNKVLVCVRNNKQTYVLLVKTDETDTTQRSDRKILELSNNDAITSISPYKNFIFISPNAGEVVYNEQEDEFGYDTATRIAANLAIKNKIDELGIDRNFYKIVNPLDY